MKYVRTLYRDKKMDSYNIKRNKQDKNNFD